MLRQGLKGYWAGFWPWGFVLGATKGSVLGGSRAFFLKIFEKDLKMSKENADLISGFCAGGVQGLITSPLLLARVRVNQSLTERASKLTEHLQQQQYNHHHHQQQQQQQHGLNKLNLSGHEKLPTGFFQEMKTSAQILNQAIKVEGPKVLLTGMPALIVKRSLDWGTRFLFINWYTHLYHSYHQSNQSNRNNNNTLNYHTSLAISFLGGTSSCLVTMPIDRLMPFLQQSRTTTNTVGAGERIGVIAFLKQKIKAEGFSTLQRGFMLRAIHTGYHTMWATVIADAIYKIIKE